MSETRRVTVIGAGIVGCNCALQLRRQGHEVTLVDRLDPGEATSAGNAGMLAAASSIPQSTPGVLKNVPRWLLDSEGPLAIRWLYLPRLMPWLARFVRSGSMETVERTAMALDALHRMTVEQYKQLTESIGAAHLIRTEGALYVFESEASFDSDALGHRLRAMLGIRSETLVGQAIRDLEPAVSPHYVKAYYLPDLGHTVDPQALTKAIARAFEEEGGRITRAEVREIEFGPDGPRSLTTDTGDIPVEVLVVAAGPWSARLAARFGDRVLLESERGYHITIRHPGVHLRIPTCASKEKVFATPMTPGIRMAGTAEFAGLDAAPNWRRAHLLARQAERMLPGINTSDYTEWMGNRPATPDDLPVIGPSPRVGNLFYAFGHGHTGLTAAPATAQLICDLIAGRQPQTDIAPYRADRF